MRAAPIVYSALLKPISDKNVTAYQSGEDVPNNDRIFAYFIDVEVPDIFAAYRYRFISSDFNLV